MCRMTSVVLATLAVVNDHASWRSSRSAPAASSASKVDSKSSRRASTSAMSVTRPSRWTRKSGDGSTGVPAVVRRLRRPTAYVVAASRLIAGRTTSSCPSSAAESTSTSAHSGIRSPDVVSTSTTLASASSDDSRSVHDGSFDAAGSRSSIQVSSGELALNPSLRFHAVGSMPMPALFVGSSPAGNATRRPVGEVSSAMVRASLGKGSRHCRVSSGSHPAGDAASCASTAATVESSALCGAGSVVGEASSVDGTVGAIGAGDTSGSARAARRERHRGEQQTRCPANRRHSSRQYRPTTGCPGSRRPMSDRSGNCHSQRTSGRGEHGSSPKCKDSVRAPTSMSHSVVLPPWNRAERGGRTLEQAVVHWRSVALVGACLAGGLTLTVMVIGSTPEVGGSVSAAAEAVVADTVAADPSITVAVDRRPR